MPKKKVIIIGAGLAGLSAGIHLQNSGIATEIFELSGQAGGVFSAWEREHYRFDGCIEWMVGTKPGDPLYKLYREVDLLTEDTPIYNAGSVKVEIGGTMYEVPLKLDAFKNFLLSISPDDTSMINDLCQNIEKMKNSKVPMRAPENLSELISLFTESWSYANLYKGSFEGFAPTPAAVRTNIRKTIDGIKGLYLCGQWTTPGGGICTAVASGKDAAISVLKAK